MSTRIESATILGISERTLRRYLSEFSGFFSSDRDLSAFDLDLLRIVHSSKTTGQNTGQKIRDQLVAAIRQADTGQDNLAGLLGSVQNTVSSPSGSDVSAGQISLSSEHAGQNGQNGQNPSALTREDLLAIVMPLVALVHTLRSDVRKLTAQLAPPLALPPATTRPPRPWHPMALPSPAPRMPPKPVSWWRAFLWPELQRAGQ